MFQPGDTHKFNANVISVGVEIILKGRTGEALTDIEVDLSELSYCLFLKGIVWKKEELMDKPGDVQIFSY